MRGTVHVALAIAMSTSYAGAAETPVWDLAKNEIPLALESGKIERVGNEVTLRDGGAFAIPAEAFPDQKNFTVQVTASVSEMVNGSIFTVMKKQSDGDDGKTDDPRGVVAGKGWALDIPKIEHPQWPKVLIYGDSISMGYRGPFQKTLSQPLPVPVEGSLKAMWPPSSICQR